MWQAPVHASVQLIGKRCESVMLHQAMSDQMGYKAKPLFKKAKRSYEAKERQDSYIDYKAKRREVVFDPWDNPAHLCRRHAARCGDGSQRPLSRGP